MLEVVRAGPCRRQSGCRQSDCALSPPVRLCHRGLGWGRRGSAAHDSWRQVAGPSQGCRGAVAGDWTIAVSACCPAILAVLYLSTLRVLQPCSSCRAEIVAWARTADPAETVTRTVTDRRSKARPNCQHRHDINDRGSCDHDYQLHGRQIGRATGDPHSQNATDHDTAET
jgi:hypothetical protein